MVLYYSVLWAGLLAFIAALFYPLAGIAVGVAGIFLTLTFHPSRSEVDYGGLVLFVMHCGLVVFSVLMLLIHFIISLF